MEERILDPRIPYVGPIRGGTFSPGKTIRIQGKVPGTAYKFDIYLQCGPETLPRDDVGMQVSVRMLDGFIKLNSLQNGNWGEEQFCVPLPIKRAEKFEISLKCDCNHYKVVVNGQHFYEFPHRMHYDRISHLAIDGDVSITQISYASASGGEIGISESGVGWAPHAPAPVPTLQIRNNTEEFEFIPPNSVATPPPSYDAAMQSNKISGNTPATGPLYPTTAPYPTNAPYPTAPSTMPMPSITPFNADGRAQTPYPTAASYSASYPSYGAPLIPPPPPGAPVPLNATSPNLQPVQRNSTTKCFTIVWATILAIIVVIAILGNS